MESMKIIDLLIKISKDLLPDKTRVIFDDTVYTYNKKANFLEKENLYRVFDTRELNNTVEIILPKEKKHE